jgi:hypothetical protein
MGRIPTPLRIEEIDINQQLAISKICHLGY